MKIGFSTIFLALFFGSATASLRQRKAGSYCESNEECKAFEMCLVGACVAVPTNSMVRNLAGDGLDHIDPSILLALNAIEAIGANTCGKGLPTKLEDFFKPRFYMRLAAVNYFGCAAEQLAQNTREVGRRLGDKQEMLDLIDSWDFGIVDDTREDFVIDIVDILNQPIPTPDTFYDDLCTANCGDICTRELRSPVDHLDCFVGERCSVSVICESVKNTNCYFYDLTCGPSSQMRETFQNLKLWWGLFPPGLEMIERIESRFSTHCDELFGNENPSSGLQGDCLDEYSYTDSVDCVKRIQKQEAAWDFCVATCSDLQVQKFNEGLCDDHEDVPPADNDENEDEEEDGDGGGAVGRCPEGHVYCRYPARTCCFPLECPPYLGWLGECPPTNGH